MMISGCCHGGCFHVPRRGSSSWVDGQSFKPEHGFDSNPGWASTPKAGSSAGASCSAESAPGPWHHGIDTAGGWARARRGVGKGGICANNTPSGNLNALSWLWCVAEPLARGPPRWAWWGQTWKISHNGPPRTGDYDHRGTKVGTRAWLDRKSKRKLLKLNSWAACFGELSSLPMVRRSDNLNLTVQAGPCRPGGVAELLWYSG